MPLANARATFSMARCAVVLDAMEPMETVLLCDADLLALGDVATVQSRRGSVAIRMRRGTSGGGLPRPCGQRRLNRPDGPDPLNIQTAWTSAARPGWRGFEVFCATASCPTVSSAARPHNQP